MDDVERDLARERLKADLSKAMTLEELAKFALKSGHDPKYVAHRYGFPLERCLQYKAAIDAKETETERRTEAAKAVAGRD